MIHFLLAGVKPESFLPVAHAVFELGCRLNARFVIHRSAETIPADAIVISYGGNRGLEIPVSPEPARLASIGGRWLYAGPGEVPDIIQGTADLLAFRHEAGLAEHRDKLGRLNAAAHPLGAGLREPLIENNAACLKQLVEASGATIAQVSTAFGSGCYAVCITHDVDGPQLHTPFALSRSLIYALRGNRYERESFELGLLTRLLRRPDPYWNFAAWQKFERAFGAKSTFLVYPGKLPSAPRHRKDPHYDPMSASFRDALSRLVDEGWEVGPHIGIRGHGVAAYRQAIERLHMISGGAISSVRTHYWSGMSPSPAAAWKDMDEAGFRVDASLSPQTIGYRGGAMMPIMPSFDGRPAPNGLVAMATPIMDAYLVPRTSGLSSSDAVRQAAQIRNNARENNGLVVLDWHCRTLCNAGAWKGFMPYLVEMLKDIASDSAARFMTMAEVGEAWRDHARRCFAGIEGSD